MGFTFYMLVNYNDKQLFKGYDVQPLRGLFVTNKDCANELRKVTGQYHLDIYTPQIASNSIQKDYFSLNKENKLLWAQDYFTFLKGKILYDNSREVLQRVLRGCAKGIQKQFNLVAYELAPYIRGGNYYICDVNGVKKLIISEDKMIIAEQILKTLPQDLKDKLTTPEDALKASYNVDEICPIPKLDYHTDLFLRPLDNGNVLLADNQQTFESLNKLLSGYRNLTERGELSETEREIYQRIVDRIDNEIKKFDITQEYDRHKPQETTEQIAEQLKEYGFNPIRVPGNYYYLEGVKSKDREKEMLANFEHNIHKVQEYSKMYSPELQKFINTAIALERVKVDNDNTIGVELENFYENNFLNAITFKDKNGKIVYITNGPLFDEKLGITPEIEEKTGLSFRNLFVESLTPYVEIENIHFIGNKLTTKLFGYMGGIHCTAAEIPA